jgi:hypothetical protein
MEKPKVFPRIRLLRKRLAKLKAELMNFTFSLFSFLFLIFYPFVEAHESYHYGSLFIKS